MTLAETLQAKLTAAKAESIQAEATIAELEAAIASAEPSWLDRDVEDVRAFFANIAHHIGL